VLQALVDAKFLGVGVDGRYARLVDGQPHPRPAKAAASNTTRRSDRSPAGARRAG
jgi:hypothetical protein